MITIEKNNFNNKTIIILSICLIVLLFMLFGGFINFSNSIKNVVWLKTSAVMGPDYRLFYPFGTCKGEKISQVLSEESSKNPASPYLAGLAAMRVSDFYLAEQKFQLAIQNDINVDSSASALGVVYYLDNKNPIFIWQQSDISTRYLMLGKECDIAKFNDLATTYYNYALETINLNNSKGYKQLVEFYAGTQDEERYKKALESYLKLADPNSIEYHWTLGNVFFTREDYSQAFDHFKYITSKKPNDQYAWYSTGQALVFLKEYDKAREALSKAILLDPKNVNFYIYMGHSYLYQQNYDQAAVWYEKALQIEQTSVWAMTHLMEVRIAQERYDEALLLASNAMKLNMRANIRATTAEIAIKMGNLPLARRYIEEAISLDSENIDYYHRFGLICEYLNDIACMKSAYQNILILNPDDVYAKDILNKIAETELR